MFKKSLILLTTTAILLPMEAVSAAGGERKYSEQERAKQERAQRSSRERSSPRQQARPERARRSEPRRSQARSAPRRETAPRASNVDRRARDVAVQDRGANQARQRTRPNSRPESSMKRATAPNRSHESSNRTVRSGNQRTENTVVRARDTAVRDRGNARSSERTSAGRSRTQVLNNERRIVRQTERSRVPSSTQRNVVVRRDENGERYTGYIGRRTTQDSRRVIRGAANDRGTLPSRVRELDYERDRAYRGNTNWDRGRVRDRKRGNYRKDWWYRDRWYRDVDVFFGFSPYYSGFGFNVGYHRGYYNAYHNGHYYGRNYYFGHWPLTAGYYHRRASWLWSHHHHHYHYGDYCPHAHNNVHVTYHDDYDTGHYSSSSSGNQVAGMLLGGIVGGIIGAEIDGGRDKTAGAVIGSVVGAAIGANAARSDDVVHRPAAGVVYDANGRHIYESETYQPPREIRTCLRYETRQSEYVCTKWTVEYEYDD